MTQREVLVIGLWQLVLVLYLYDVIVAAVLTAFFFKREALNAVSVKTFQIFISHLVRGDNEKQPLSWCTLTCARCRYRGRWDRSRRLDPGIWCQSICRFHIHMSHDHYIAGRSWRCRWTHPGSSRRRFPCNWRHTGRLCTRTDHVLVRHRGR